MSEKPKLENYHVVKKYTERYYPFNMKYQNLSKEVKKVITKENYIKQCQKALEHFDFRCSKCKRQKEPHDFIIHHLDLNDSNNEVSNLLPLCRNCHSTLHRKIEQAALSLVNKQFVEEVTKLFLEDTTT